MLFRDAPDQPNKVLLFTIMNPVYPITTVSGPYLCLLVLPEFYSESERTKLKPPIISLYGQ